MVRQPCFNTFDGEGPSWGFLAARSALGPSKSTVRRRAPAAILWCRRSTGPSHGKRPRLPHPPATPSVETR
jgi:hypothetical protein